MAVIITEISRKRLGDNLDFLSSYGVQGLGYKENGSHNSTKTHIDIKSIYKQDSKRLSYF